MNLSTHQPLHRDAPPPTRDELALEVHISNELIAAGEVRAALLNLIRVIDRMSSLDYIPGWDKDSLLDVAREWSALDDAAVERAARDGFVGVGA